MGRDFFKDARVREAFNLALPFEDMNKTLFYGQYKRIDSYFYGSSLASSGLPEGKELDLGRVGGVYRPVPGNSRGAEAVRLPGGLERARAAERPAVDRLAARRRAHVYGCGHQDRPAQRE